MKTHNQSRIVRMAILCFWLLAAATTQAFYNPTTGRWINRDPIGEEGGQNLYSLVKNQAPNAIDPQGTFTLLDTLASSAEEADGMVGEIARGYSLISKIRDTVETFNSIQEFTSMMMDLADQSENGEEVMETLLSMGQQAIVAGFQNKAMSMVTAGTIGVIGSTTRIQDALGGVLKFLGKGGRVITNKNGDKVFLSADGNRRFRSDFNNPSPHTNPHVHVEENVNGTWKGSGPIYPSDLLPF